MAYLSNIIYIYYIVQLMSEEIYSKLQVDFMVSGIRFLTVCSMKLLTSSRVLQNRLVNFLFINAHIFSAGLSSGLYGGKKSRTIFSGTFNLAALWKAPLSNTIILNSSGLCLDISSRNNWKHSVLQLGSSSIKLDPSMGENAPNR